MDIDNSMDPSQQTAADVEMALLQQFSCMGTTDHDELISQLQRLLGKDVQYSTAAFFLDMNNWNLQGAVCSYLDMEAINSTPSFCIANDLPNIEVLPVEFSSEFEYYWNLRNDGNFAWPSGCYVHGDFNDMTIDRYYLPPLRPGEACKVTFKLKALPHLPNRRPTISSVNVWKAYTPDNKPFGPNLLIRLKYECKGSLEMMRMMQYITGLGSPPPVDAGASNPFENSRNQNGDESSDMC